jgi:hypothetical protein
MRSAAGIEGCAVNLSSEALGAGPAGSAPINWVFLEMVENVATMARVKRAIAILQNLENFNMVSSC